LRSGGRIAVQLERRGKGRTSIGGTDVIDVARITGSTVLGIDQVNDVVKRGGLTPPFVAPVTTAITKHAGEVTHRGNAWSRERRTGVGVSPSVSAVG
jgi:hypothetical protein